MIRSFFPLDCSDQAEEQKTKTEVKQANSPRQWFGHVFVQVCRVGLRGWRGTSGQLGAAAKDGSSRDSKGELGGAWRFGKIASWARSCYFCQVSSEVGLSSVVWLILAPLFGDR